MDDSKVGVNGTSHAGRACGSTEQPHVGSNYPTAKDSQMEGNGTVAVEYPTRKLVEKEFLASDAVLGSHKLDTTLPDQYQSKNVALASGRGTKLPSVGKALHSSGGAHQCSTSSGSNCGNAAYHRVLLPSTASINDRKTPSVDSSHGSCIEFITSSPPPYGSEQPQTRASQGPTGDVTFLTPGTDPEPAQRPAGEDTPLVKIPKPDGAVSVSLHQPSHAA